LWSSSIVKFMEQSLWSSPKHPLIKKKTCQWCTLLCLYFSMKNGLLVYIEILNAYFHAEERVILLND
jgi:hypothetical protein